MSDDFRERALLWPKGNFWEDFDEGRMFEHRLGRTVSDSDNTLFTVLTLHYNPLYLDAAACAAAGHGGRIVNPLLVFNIVFGLSVEALSEGGGPFLGVDELSYHAPVYVGETLYARSTVLGRRLSASNKDYAIATWRTEGRNQDGAPVIAFTRTNLVRRRPEQDEL
ncbi:MaoC family dehydratase [Sphingopyxis kveilinensis]|uniref:MaoC family dehydratase n=1 Tax=Sphingopyxis kveilinensis TaxID=3114367 RepID=UPI0030CF2B0F